MRPSSATSGSETAQPWLHAPRLLATMSVAFFLLIAAAQSSVAQEAAGSTGDGGSALGGNDDEPIEISADNGIEWKRDARTYTARGNALAVQGDTRIAGDTLIAYLDEQDELSSWEAIGNVTIKNDKSTSYGDRAVYREDTRVLVLTGQKLKVVTEEQTVTARDQIEYWRDKDAVVAKGNVVILRPQKQTTIRSDEATGYFRDKVDDPATPGDEGGDSEFSQLIAKGHVRVDRKEQTAFSDHLAYNPDTEIAVLTGNVVINSKDNRYTGARAELDLKQDISRLLPAEGQRVHTVIKPKKKSETPESGAAPVTQ
jgi:lipopolysaccharide export system protein LptA